MDEGGVLVVTLLTWVQLWFDEGGVLAPLMELTSDEDATCKTKVCEVTVAPLDPG